MKKYKFLTVLIITGIVMIITMTCISCAGNKTAAGNIKELKPAASEEKAEETDYSGVYRSSDAGKCNIVITVIKEKTYYTYAINGAGIKSSGKLESVKEDQQTYLIFTGTKRSGDNTSVEGAYTDKKILIQNYGNSINQYICFKKCSAKFLEFVRAD